MAGIVEPVAPPLQSRLRRAVWELARSERRRRFPAVLHAGEPGGVAVELQLDDTVQPTDHALRTDVLSALARRILGAVDPPLVWLTRPGSPAETRDADLEWLAAARAAAAELATPLTFVVVSRRAWRDPGTGVGRVWRRPRPGRKD